MQPASKEQTTFLRLLDQYQPALWRLVNAYEQDASRRDDLFQEIALNLWRALPRFRGDSSERTWLYRIAHNVAISGMQSRRRTERREKPIADSLDPPHAGAPSDELIEAREKHEALLAAIRELPALDRGLIILHLEGLSYHEIEQVAGLSESAIGSRLTRIRGRLTELIREKGARK
jgi:RNA polymerase sigma-70 factor, ECF subfamily